MVTFGQARDAYANQAGLRSAHTHSAYMRAIDVFLEFLNDREWIEKLPIYKKLTTSPDELPLNAMQAEDEALIGAFALWMRTPARTGDKRPYSPATLELRLAGIKSWFEFMQGRGWLPDGFSAENAFAKLKSDIAPQKNKPAKAVTLTQDLTRLMDYYSGLTPSKQVRSNEDRLQRWELTRQRNHALVQMLSETGGQISGILSLNTDTFLARENTAVLQMQGKGGHSYQIVLSNSLPAIYRYLAMREIPPERAAFIPLFVSHDARYEMQRMSRVIAWRIVQRGARGVGLPEVSPHDFRHWRAQQLIQAGHSLEDVQTLLGHRSIHTIRTYYGHLASPES